MQLGEALMSDKEVGRISVVNVASHYGLNGWCSNPGVGKIFHTGSEAHPDSFSMGPGSFLRVQRPVHGADIKERVELYPYSRTVPPWPVRG